MTILETKDLRKVYGSGDTEVRALDGVNLTVERGEYLCIHNHTALIGKGRLFTGNQRHQSSASFSAATLFHIRDR